MGITGDSLWLRPRRARGGEAKLGVTVRTHLRRFFGATRLWACRGTDEIANERSGLLRPYGGWKLATYRVSLATTDVHLDVAQVADFVLDEFQAAWGVVPNSTQYDAWVHRIIANPSLENGGMSQALAGSPEFTLEYGTTRATEPATVGFIDQICAHVGLTPGPGAMANVSLPVWQVLQNFMTSAKVIANLDALDHIKHDVTLAGVSLSSLHFDASHVLLV